MKEIIDYKSVLVPEQFENYIITLEMIKTIKFEKLYTFIKTKPERFSKKWYAKKGYLEKAIRETTDHIEDVKRKLEEWKSK